MMQRVFGGGMPRGPGRPVPQTQFGQMPGQDPAGNTPVQNQRRQNGAPYNGVDILRTEARDPNRARQMTREQNAWGQGQPGGWNEQQLGDYYEKMGAAARANVPRDTFVDRNMRPTEQMIRGGQRFVADTPESRAAFDALPDWAKTGNDAYLAKQFGKVLNPEYIKTKFGDAEAKYTRDAEQELFNVDPNSYRAQRGRATLNDKRASLGMPAYPGPTTRAPFPPDNGAGAATAATQSGAGVSPGAASAFTSALKGNPQLMAQFSQALSASQDPKIKAALAAAQGGGNNAGPANQKLSSVFAGGFPMNGAAGGLGANPTGTGTSSNPPPTSAWAQHQAYLRQFTGKGGAGYDAAMANPGNSWDGQSIWTGPTPPPDNSWPWAPRGLSSSVSPLGPAPTTGAAGGSAGAPANATPPRVANDSGMQTPPQQEPMSVPAPGGSGVQNPGNTQTPTGTRTVGQGGTKDAMQASLQAGVNPENLARGSNANPIQSQYYPAAMPQNGGSDLDAVMQMILSGYGGFGGQGGGYGAGYLNPAGYGPAFGAGGGGMMPYDQMAQWLTGGGFGGRGVSPAFMGGGFGNSMMSDPRLMDPGLLSLLSMYGGY